MTQMTQIIRWRAFRLPVGVRVSIQLFSSVILETAASTASRLRSICDGVPLDAAVVPAALTFGFTVFDGALKPGERDFVGVGLVVRSPAEARIHFVALDLEAPNVVFSDQASGHDAVMSAGVAGTPFLVFGVEDYDFVGFHWFSFY